MALPSAQAFFTDILDFAGLFPPAALKVPTAINNYIAYRSHPANWILSNFLATSSHIEEMLKINTLPVGYKIGLAVVSRNLGADLSSITNSLEKLSDKLDLKAVEVAIDAHNPVFEQIGKIELDIASLESKVGSTRLFLEIPACGAWDKILPVLLDAAVESASRSGRKIGFKLRCGGESHLIPSSKRVVKVLRECAARNLPIKFTAGLHQPFRHQAATALNEAPVAAHGFFNIFFAALLANRAEMSEAALVEIVSEANSVEPVFTQSGVEWLGHTLSNAEIAELRLSRVLSFGSCSFLEPVDESNKRGWF